MNLQEYYRNRKFKILGVYSFLLVCFWWQLTSASTEIGLKLNTSANQRYFSYNNIRFASNSLYEIDSQQTYQGRSGLLALSWIILEFVGGVGGGIVGGWGGSAVADNPDAPLGLLNIPIGLGSGTAVSLIGAIGHQKGSVIGAFIEAGVGALQFLSSWQVSI